MSFVQVWLIAYYNPARAVEGLKHKPAPQWGLYGVLIRCLFVSLLWYLPAYLLGRTPSSAPFLTNLSAENYYAALVVIFPAFTLATWLLHGALSHLILRLSGRGGGIDQVLNIDGVGNLLVGVPLVAFDWIALALLGWDSATVGSEPPTDRCLLHRLRGDRAQEDAGSATLVRLGSGRALACCRCPAGHDLPPPMTPERPGTRTCSQRPALEGEK